MKRVAVVLMCLIMLGGLASGAIVKVIEISNYKVEVEVGDNVHVKETITLHNLVNNPLVPGIGEIRLQKVSPKKVWKIAIPFTEVREPVKVVNVKGYLENGREIPVKVIEKGNFTIIHYEVWYPIKPKGNLTFILEFDSPNLVDKGILFIDATIPVGADVDIKRAEVVVKSDKYQVVYSSKGASSLRANTLAFYTFELSLLPLPNIGYKWSVVFWLALMGVIGAVGVWRTRRRKLKGKQKKEETPEAEQTEESRREREKEDVKETEEAEEVKEVVEETAEAGKAEKEKEEKEEMAEDVGRKEKAETKVGEDESAEAAEEAVEETAEAEGVKEEAVEEEKVEEVGKREEYEKLMKEFERIKRELEMIRKELEEEHMKVEEEGLKGEKNES